MIKVYPENPAPRHIKMIVDVLKDGGIIIYPTDTVYAIGCDMTKAGAIDKLCRIIGKKPENANLSLICHDLSNISEYTSPFSTNVFKTMKKVLPGAYTFILNANNKVPKIFRNKAKRTVGIRVPDNNLDREIVKELGNPIVSASLHSSENGFEDYMTNPDLINEKYHKLVDLLVDGGPGDNRPSSIIDCTGEEIEIIREGKGAVEVLR
jgi:tRNA threonylcarbamoyl adenosine modification protein (Sua5/YciO/YrdC/YwlC family)